MAEISPRITKSINQIHLEFAELKARLEEAESTIDAIRTGAVDAILVHGETGDQVYTLQGWDEPYRIFVEQMREGALTLGVDGTILYCNQAFANMVGGPLEQVMGSALQTHIVTDEPNEALEALKSGRSEATLKGGNGELPVLCSAFPTSTGGPGSTAITLTDLSEQKRHEVELTKATEELEGFCYTVSHDMRAPLRSMISAANIVMLDHGKYVPQEAVKELNRIAASASHLGQLMDDLLSHARLSKHAIKRQSVDLSEMSTRIAGGLSSAGYDGVEWTIDRPLRTSGDPHLLEIVMQNFLANAAKFAARSNPPRIQVGFDESKRAFFVRDNGIGFNMAYVDKLFLPFERLHRQNEYPGTGIGLANVKRILNRHGGKVWAEGHEGEGATFYFTVEPELF